MSESDQAVLTVPSALSDREGWLEPFDWYEQMRDTGSVQYDERRGVWDVFRYDEVKAVLDDDERFSVDPRNAASPRQNPDEGPIGGTMLTRDPPRHDELRSVVEEAFRPRQLRELVPRMRTITHELLDDALADADGQFDLVEALSYPLPVIVIAELLGVPSEEREQFKQWSDTLVRDTDDETEAEAVVEAREDAGEEMADYFARHLEERRENPRDDLLTTIATNEGAGGQLSHREALGTCTLLLTAGNITTTNLITNAVRCLDTQDAETHARLADDEAALSSAIEETLRYRSPVQAILRNVTRETELDGKTLQAGEELVLWAGSANRDERQFDDADTFVPDRSPNQHLGFGYGTHYCLGAPLARLEAKIALDVLFDRLSGLEVVDTELQPVRSSFIYGVESLPVSYESAT